MASIVSGLDEDRARRLPRLSLRVHEGGVGAFDDPVALRGAAQFLQISHAPGGARG